VADPLDRDTVRRIAFLARIRVAEADLDDIARELSHIIGWVEQLAEVDTGDVEPMTSVAEMSLRQRPDAVADGGNPAAVLANAPDRTDSFFAVPKVVEG
jgi:aspartyl-tRNA(Asn)/glutamyl-tRNA(Gln) amidotransferase subunit C